jgi:hypothetical protein
MESLGYGVERADQLSEPGMITNQIVRNIVDCDILIADLSESNPNVFYELAIRHGLKRPFIHIIDASESIPFDNAQVRTIPVDLTDLDSVDKAKADLNAQVAAIEGGTLVAESPISIAFDLDALKSSGNTDDAMLAALFREVSSMRGEIRELRRQPMRRPIRSDSPATEEELLTMLVAAGKGTIAHKIQNANIVGLKPYKLEMTTSLSFDEDRELETELKEFLERQTGHAWDVDILPF